MLLCPMCEKTEVFLGTYSLEILVTPRDWNGPKVLVEGLEGWYCNHCNDYCIDPDQARAHEPIFKAAREKAQNEANKTT